MQTNYTLLTPLQSSGKMEVTPQQSEILQTELFKMGYVLHYIDRSLIIWYADEKISIGHVSREHFLKSEKPKIITPASAMKKLECKKTKFYKDYVPLLKMIKPDKYRTFFLEDEVNALAATLVSAKYQIVE